MRRYSPGRPRKYQAILDNGPREGWFPITETQANRTAPSGFRSRYASHDFKAERNETGKYTLFARRLGDEEG